MYHRKPRTKIDRANNVLKLKMLIIYFRVKQMNNVSLRPHSQDQDIQMIYSFNYTKIKTICFYAHNKKYMDKYVYA